LAAKTAKLVAKENSGRIFCQFVASQQIFATEALKHRNLKNNSPADFADYAEKKTIICDICDICGPSKICYRQNQ